MSAEWEDYLARRFPGYLLPEAMHQRLEIAAAARFLETLTGRPNQLELLRATSMLVPRISLLVEFVEHELPALVRFLPSRTEVEARLWRGGFHGKLDVAATQKLHAHGETTSFVTRARHRTFDLPENVLVRATAERILQMLVDLRHGQALPETGWGSRLRGCEGALRRILQGTVLREVPLAAVTPHEEVAAQAARHPTYRAALRWHRELVDELDTSDPARIARVVADGALAPLDPATRFEVSVALRLVEALEAFLRAESTRRWTLERTLVLSGRKELVAFDSSHDHHIRVHYNQAVLPSGTCDLGAAHYLGNSGRLRPDVTVIVLSGAKLVNAAVIEVKLSSDVGYLTEGFHEAVLYRWEYAEHLKGWPKAVLVSPASVVGSPKADDDVVALDWASWPSKDVLAGLVGCAL